LKKIHDGLINRLDDDQISMVKDTLKSQADFFAKDLCRLRSMEKEYHHLLTLISIIVHRDIIDDSVNIKITKAAQLSGKDWRDILEMSIDKNGSDD